MQGRKIEGTVALVTGANRGIGRALLEALIERGVGKVYAAARDPESLEDLAARHGDRVVALRLDVTDTEQVAAAVAAVPDLELLINNAGVALATGFTDEAYLDQARAEMEVNYFGPLRLVKQLTPTLAANGGGGVVNLSSVGGLTNFPLFPTYSASKAAVHSLTQAFRVLLGGQGTLVYGVYPGPVDTDMARGVEMEKTSPRDVALAILDGIEAGREDIYPDPFASDFGRQFQASPKGSEEQVAAMVAALAA